MGPIITFDYEQEIFPPQFVDKWHSYGGTREMIALPTQGQDLQWQQIMGNK